MTGVRTAFLTCSWIHNKIFPSNCNKTSFLCITPFFYVFTYILCFYCCPVNTLLEQILAENKSIEVVIDLHRDGVGNNTRLVTEQNGVPMAQIMFFNGLSRTTKTGDIEYLYNPYIADNLAISFQMQLKAAEYYPGFTRRIYLKGYR